MSGRELLPEYQDVFPDMNKILIPAPADAGNFGRGFGSKVSYTPSGPLFEYHAERVGNTVPKTAQELPDWTRAHPEAVP